MITLYNIIVAGYDHSENFNTQFSHKCYYDKEIAIDVLMNHINKYSSSKWHIDIQRNVPIDENEPEKLTPYKVSVTNYEDEYIYKMFWIREIKFDESELVKRK